ncbi:hypothetical protein J6590_068584 [Homalodisca vitripennis]|nr:hypothetical protein J6590_068584 [Homalodisca vitripennis]
MLEAEYLTGTQFTVTTEVDVKGRVSDWQPVLGHNTNGCYRQTGPPLAYPVARPLLVRRSSAAALFLSRPSSSPCRYSIAA